MDSYSVDALSTCLTCHPVAVIVADFTVVTFEICQRNIVRKQNKLINNIVLTMEWMVDK